MATNTSTNKFEIGKNPMAYTIFPSETEEGRDFIHEPPMAKIKSPFGKNKYSFHLHFMVNL